jgi:hypothetical protein
MSYWIKKYTLQQPRRLKGVLPSGVIPVWVYHHLHRNSASFLGGVRLNWRNHEPKDVPPPPGGG